MSKVMVNESSLSSIGEAIRGKNGTTNTYKPSEMAAAISNITTGGNFDFSNLEYVQLTSSAGSELPDLTPFISDFDKVVCIMIQGADTFYVYLRGTDTDRSSYKDLFYYHGSRGSYSTPSTEIDETNCFALNVIKLDRPKIVYINYDNTVQTRPWFGGFIMFYEED